MARPELWTRIDRRPVEKALQDFPPAAAPECIRYPAEFPAHRGLVGRKDIRRAAENCQVHVEKELAVAPPGVIEPVWHMVTSGCPDHASDQRDPIGAQQAAQLAR